MYELLTYGFGILFAVVVLIGIPYNIIKAKRANKKVIIIVNCLLVLASAALWGFSRLDEKLIADSTSGCKLAKYGFLGSLNFTGTNDGYLTFRVGVLLGEYHIAVPAGNIELPPAVKEDTSVIIAYKDIYTEDDDNILWFGRKTRTIGSKEYYIADNAVKVFRNYESDKLNILICDIALLFLFNFTELIILTSRHKKK